MHLAVQGGNLEIIQVLLGNGFNINAKNSTGETPLFFSIRNGDLDLVDFLIFTGADVNAVDEFGNTPLHVAADYGNLEMVTYLLDKGSRNTTNSAGLVPLHLALEKCHFDITEVLSF